MSNSQENIVHSEKNQSFETNLEFTEARIIIQGSNRYKNDLGNKIKWTQIKFLEMKTIYKI